MFVLNYGFLCTRNIYSTAKSWFRVSSILDRVTRDYTNNRFTMKLPTDTAYIAYVPMNGGLNLTTMFVPRRYRRIGIGAKMAMEVFEYCLENDIKIFLTCSYLVAFYEQNPYPQFSKIIMTKEH